MTCTKPFKILHNYFLLLYSIYNAIINRKEEKKFIIFKVSIVIEMNNKKSLAERERDLCAYILFYYDYYEFISVNLILYLHRFLNSSFDVVLCFLICI